MTDQHAELKGNPGPILKAAREEQGLSLVEVAEKLHLRGSVVDAMEREDFAQFNSPIFLKGYFRSYCRLMKLHEDRMLALLEKQLVGYYGAMDDARNNQLRIEQKQVRQRMLKKLALFLILLLVPVTLLFFTTSGFNSQGAATPASETPVPESEQQAQAPAAIVAESIVVPEQEFSYSDSSEGEPSSGVEEAPLAEGDVADIASGTVSPTTVAPSPAIPSKTTETTLIAPVADTVETAATFSSASETPVASFALADGSKSLTFTFTADCWVKLTDGKGKVRVAELKYAGDTFTISAQVPLTLVLGNAKAVGMTVDNQPYDLIQHTTQNGRVALVIK